MKPRHNLFLRLAIVGSSLLSFSLSASAQIYWDGSLSGTTALWATTSGWTIDPSLDAPDPDSFPGENDIAAFSSSNVFSAQTILLNANHAAAGLSFPLVTASHTFNSDSTTARTLTIGTSGIDMPDAESAGGNATIGSTINVPLGVQQNWQVGTNRILSVNGVISGAAAFTKNGNGTLTLNGANTFSGSFTHNIGLLSLNNATALGSATGTFFLAGGTIQNASTTGPLTISNAKPITLTGNFGYVVPTNGNGTLNLGTGPVTLAPTSGSSITVDNGAGIISFDGPVSGSGMGIVKTGTGTLALLGNNTYTGLTDIRQSANLRINGSAGIATTNVFLNGGLLDLGGPVVENNTFVLGTAPGQIRFKSDTPAHGGFGSASGYRKVSLTSEGVPNAPLVWGVTPHFMAAAAWSSSNGIILLNTTLSGGTLELTNNLDFGGLDRRFSVRDGSAPNMPDAVLSGVLSNGVLSVQTSGTLFVSNPANTLSGATYVSNGGALRVPEIAGYLGTSNVILDNGMLELGANASVTIGTAPGNVSFAIGGGGFSSYGGTRSVSIGGTSDPLTWGATGFLAAGGNLLLGGSGSDGLTRLTNPIDLGASLRNVVVQNGGGYIDASLDGLLSGTGGGLHLSAGNGTLQLANPANSYTGVTQISSGALALDTLANGGLPSNIGASSNATGNLLLTGGSIRYIGNTGSTDRLFELRANATISSAGFGPITFSNTGTNAFTSTGTTGTTRSFSLSGISTGVNVFNSGITNSTATLNHITSLTKSGTTTWSVGGNNSFTGNTTIGAGELILDFSGGNNPMAGNGSVIIDNSNLIIKGKAAGVTNAAFNILRFGNGSNGITNVLKLDAPQASGGISLAVTNFGGSTTTANSLTSNLVDLSSNAGNTVTVTTVNNGFSFVNNVVVANATGSPLNGGRSNLIVKDSTGYGFASFAGALPSTLTRLTDATTTALDATNSSNTTNYRLSYAEMTPDSGTLPNERKLTRTAALVYGTLAIDATGGPVHLELGASNLGNGTASNGRGILVTGNQDVRFSSSTGTMAYSPFFYHYGTGKLDFSVPVANGFSVIAGGDGFYDYTGSISGTDARFYIDGPLFRFSLSTDFSLLNGGGIWVGNDGIIEIANDLNGGAAGDFSNAIGNNNGNVRLTGDSGFSAFGGNRTANFGGAAAQLVWGVNYFLTNGGGGDVDVALKLSSPKSDSTIEIVNPIALGVRDRVIDVTNGSAEADAILSGEISGLTVGIYKRGLGTLVLNATNTYTGITNVEAGVLRLTKASLANTSTVRISTGAKLDLAHGQTDTVAALVVNGTPVAPNIYGAADLPLYLSGSGKLNVGGVPGGTTPYDDWVTSNTLPGDKDEPEQDADNDGLRNLLEYSVGSNPSQPSGSVLSKAAGNTGAVVFNRAPNRTDITTVVETSTDLALNSWSIVATSTAGAAYVSNNASVIVTDSNNPSANSAVSVTDNRAPIPAKRFYRIRVTK